MNSGASLLVLLWRKHVYLHRIAETMIFASWNTSTGTFYQAFVSFNCQVEYRQLVSYALNYIVTNSRPCNLLSRSAKSTLAICSTLWESLLQYAGRACYSKRSIHLHLLQCCFHHGLWNPWCSFLKDPCCWAMKNGSRIQEASKYSIARHSQVVLVSAACMSLQHLLSAQKTTLSDGQVWTHA